MSRSPVVRRCSWIAIIFAAALAVARAKEEMPSPDVPAATPTPTPGTRYKQSTLISDWPGLAPNQDLLLVNPWGISMTASSPFWLANNGTSTSSLYRGDVGSV